MAVWASPPGYCWALHFLEINKDACGTPDFEQHPHLACDFEHKSASEHEKKMAV